jgi:tetrahydrodipicolinate N-succinyltransferase
LIANIADIAYTSAMFKSLPLTVRNVQATEARLQSIYDAAKLGLKGDSLALAAGMLPAEYRQLCQLDPLAEMAEQKGRADNEREISQVLNSAALGGDAKAALEILRHRHEWTAKQEVSVDVYQRISITQALEAAQTRVLENAKNDLYISRRADVDDAVVVTRNSERS